MAFELIGEAPLPEAIRERYPVGKDLAAVKVARDEELREIFEHKSDRMMLIVGPCSADNEDAVCEYVGRMAKLQETVRDKLVLVPRIYTNKPRTTGEGYKGMAHQPDPEKDPDIVEGLESIRKMHIRALAESHLTAADEMLYPGNFPYVEDILSYVAVGARSTENQQHRLTASGVGVPVGMKNPTGGDIGVMLNAVYAAQIPHELNYNRWVARTTGNPLTHAILRGWVDSSGQSYPNYHYEDLLHIAEAYTERNLDNPTLVVDANHNNSNKQFAEQPRIIMEVMRSRSEAGILKEMVRGLMVESYLEEGTQKVEEGVFGKSITDPCLGWEATDGFVKELAERV
ncbi:MAG: 3-deoxy-7-phosphoheptulonate synthase [Gemmatimonadetes bacterium]|nr:3-deoxy-7-phosphoheptulonate synthase [Gemmatimonadota bacterium]|tara:strand:- start:410 stop:1438 length:1029 start_codon:yes stop_codon:yes gene_type:complete